LAITSILLIFISVLTPLLDVSILEIHQNLSIFDSFVVFLNNHLFLESFILATTIFIIPLMMLFSIIIIISFTFFKKSLKNISFIFKTYNFLKEWNMSDVYIVGVLASMIKLDRISLMHIDIGLYLFFGFLFTFFLTIRFFNHHDVWHKELLK